MNVSDYTKIKTISLYDSASYLLEYLDKITNLEFLSITKYDSSIPVINILNFICDNVDQFSKLKKLVMKPKIEIIPPSISLLHLTYLELDSNKIKELPEEIFEMISLETLYVKNNMLTYISPSLRKLKNLQHLDLSENQIEDIDFTLPLLRGLYLYDNKLTILPEIEKPSNIEEVKNIEMVLCDNPYLYLTGAILYWDIGNDYEDYINAKELELKNMGRNKKSARK